MPLQSQFTGALLPLARNWRRAVDIVVAPFGVSEALAAPLIYLGRSGGAISQSELAELSGIGGPALVRVLDRLETMGLVQRRIDPDDKRIRRVSLTEAGQGLVTRMEQAIDTVRERVLAEFSEQDIATCIKVFAGMSAALAQGGGLQFAREADEADQR